MYLYVIQESKKRNLEGETRDFNQEWTDLRLGSLQVLRLLPAPKDMLWGSGWLVTVGVWMVACLAFSHAIGWQPACTPTPAQ